MLVSLVSRYLIARSAFLAQGTSDVAAAAAWSAMEAAIAEADAAGLGWQLVESLETMPA